MDFRWSEISTFALGVAVFFAAWSAAAQLGHAGSQMKVERLLGAERERVYTARELRWTFPGLPAVTDWRETNLERGARTIRVGDFVDAAWPSESAVGLRVVAQSLSGFRFVDVPLAARVGFRIAGRVVGRDAPVARAVG